MSPSNRRRRYWIHPEFQRRYLAQIFLLELIVMAATALLTFIFAFLLVSPGFTMGPDWGGMVAGFVVLALLLGGLMAWLGVRLSHRICGPLYRIQSELEAARAGEPIRPIRLRRHDQFQDLAATINRSLYFHQQSADADQIANHNEN